MNMIYDIVSCASPLAAVVTADPKQPYLAHHDVGVPLLGTVMSLEAMAECAACLWGKAPRQLSGITAGKDCLVRKKKELSVSLRCCGSGLLAALSDGESPVFSCDISFDAPELPPQKNCPPEEPGVTAEAIYRCFFHGPAFRVVERAHLRGDALIARFCPTVPPLTLETTRSSVLPVRIMEFCLQSAGLLDIGLRRYLSVPLSIGQVLLYGEKDLTGLWAEAVHSGPGTDIHAFNRYGRPVLSVLDYRTKPMPYESRELNAVWQGLRPFDPIPLHR